MADPRKARGTLKFGALRRVFRLLRRAYAAFLKSRICASSARWNAGLDVHRER